MANRFSLIVVGVLAIPGAGCSDDSAPTNAAAGASAGGGAGTGGTPAAGGAQGGSAQGGSSSGSGGTGTAGGSAGSAGSAGTGGGASGSGGTATTPWVPDFETVTLSTDYYGEGAGVADIDMDGVLDIVGGPNWYAGPEFNLGGGAIEDAPIVNPTNYSRHFLNFVDDLNGDTYPDVIAIGDAGGANGTGTPNAFWYQNPGPDNLADAWVRRPLFEDIVTNESPAYVNLVGDANEELVFMTEGGELGYARPGASPNDPWVFSAISGDLFATPYVHGLGVGDVNNDGALDVMERDGWWEQVPGQGAADPTWVQHEADFHLQGRGGAQMYAFDVDGDQDNDIVTSLDGHEYGLSWFEQTPSGFTQREILADSAGAMNVSQLHAVAVGDLNGDGLFDIVTGKRYYAHPGTTDPGGEDPAIISWFELGRDASAPSFVQHQIHDDSGVGCVFVIRDVDGNQKPDIVVSNKKGTFLHRQL